MPQMSPTSAFGKLRPPLLVFLIALIASASAFAASEKSIKGEQMLQEAILKNDIRDLPSFEMKASVRLDNHGHPVDGSYWLLWNGPDQWREEITFPGYSEIQLTGKDAVSVKRTTEYMPWQIDLLHNLLGYGQDLRLRANERVKQIHNREIRAIKASCVEVAGKFVPRQVCIDPSNGSSRTRIAACGCKPNDGRAQRVPILSQLCRSWKDSRRSNDHGTKNPSTILRIGV